MPLTCHPFVTLLPLFGMQKEQETIDVDFYYFYSIIISFVYWKKETKKKKKKKKTLEINSHKVQ